MCNAVYKYLKKKETKNAHMYNVSKSCAESAIRQTVYICNSNRTRHDTLNNSKYVFFKERTFKCVLIKTGLIKIYGDHFLKTMATTRYLNHLVIQISHLRYKMSSQRFCFLLGFTPQQCLCHNNIVKIIWQLSNFTSGTLPFIISSKIGYLSRITDFP